jgi:glycosyltransferase involved in cell wall biosynthesis
LQLKENRGYILCTVARNEERYLPNLAAAILSQSQRPLLWVLLDDQSTDETTNQMKELAMNHPWIYYYRYEGNRSSQLGMHLAAIKSCATKLAIQICSQKNISYEFIGIIDADIQIDTDFYEKMIDRMIEEPSIGLISARLRELCKNDKIQLRKSRDDLPGCATIICRKKCFKDINGIDPSLYPEDAIMIAKANLKNWKTERHKELTAFQLRRTSSSKGMRNGFIYEGEKVFFLRDSLLYLLIKMVYIAIFERIDYGLAFLWGYLKKVLKSEKRLEDEEIIQFFRKRRRLQNIIKSCYQDTIKTISEHFQ